MKQRTSTLRAAAFLAALAAGANAPAADAPQRPVVDFGSCPKPAWPDADHKAGNTGTVKLRFTVDASGMVKDSAIVKTSGHPGLDEAARSGIAKCRFKDGPGEVQLQYVWTLE